MSTPCYLRLVYGPDVAENNPDPVINAIIPLTGKHRLLSKKVYGDDEVQELYVEHTLDVEAIIYNETMTGGGSNVEAEVERLRNILLTPGLELKLHPIGLGELGVINVDDPDVKGGPFPQDVSVQPIASNSAIFVRWSVMFRTAPCDYGSTLSTLLQYNVEQDMNVDDDGNMEFTVNITYQSKDPITDPQDLIDISNILVRQTGKSFQGMTKRKRTSLSRDQRIMSIRLVYKEIESDSAYFPYTSNIQINDELESNLLGSSKYAGTGFYTWRRTIGGTIRLPARIHKAYAWFVFLKILKERFRGLRLLGKIKAVLDATPASTVNDEVAETNWYLPLKVKLTNPIYSREMRFECTYVVCTDLSALVDATRIFNRVDAKFDDEDELFPSDISDQWQDWQLKKDIRLTGKFEYVMDGTPIVYNQCDGTYTNHTISPNRLLDEEQEEEDTSSEDKTASDVYDPGSLGFDTKYTWIKYDNDFEIEEDTNIIPVSYLEQPDSSYYQNTDGAYANRAVEGMTINGKATNSSQTNPSTAVERGHSTFYIRMKGHAMRAGAKIPLPFIVSVGGKQVRRVSNRVSQKQISTGDIPVYLAKWDVLYSVIGGDIYSEDILSTIVSSGVPAAYQ